MLEIAYEILMADNEFLSYASAKSENIHENEM